MLKYKTMGRVRPLMTLTALDRNEQASNISNSCERQWFVSLYDHAFFQSTPDGVQRSALTF